MINFTEWFEIDNVRHLLAYAHLTRTGFWPEHFIPNDIVFENNWQFIIMSKMAQNYVDSKLIALNKYIKV